MRKFFSAAHRLLDEPWTAYHMLTYVIVGVVVSLFVPESWIQ